MTRPVEDTRPRLSPDSIPDDHDFVCLTLGPAVFGAPDARAPFRLDGTAIYFGSPVKIGDHWLELLGKVSLEKLYRTRLAFVASHMHSNHASSTVREIIAELETRAYNAMRAILIQGNPFENSTAGLEIRRVFDARRFREESANMRPRTGHHWEKIISIDDHVLDTARDAARSIEKIFASPGEFARLQRGLDHWDQATMEHRLDLRLHTLVRALEALFAPDRGKTQNQFVDRCKVMVKAGHADRLLNEIYELRNQVEHSNDWRLAFRRTRGSMEESDADLLATLRVLQIELITRKAYLRVLLDPTFLEVFRSDDTIRAFWKSQHRERAWGRPIELESEINRSFDPHKPDVLDQVLKVERRAK